MPSLCKELHKSELVFTNISVSGVDFEVICPELYLRGEDI
jgi:hypothetical protein